MSDKEEKIGGYDKWEIESCYDTLIKAKEILADEKKVAAVKIYAKEAQEAAAKVSAELDLEKTEGKKLAEMAKIKHNPNNAHKKGKGSY